jgi:hypothetical protein
MNELEKIHEEVFGIPPVIIGLHWDDVEDRLIAAINSDTPYNEEKELTPVELAEFRAERAVF